MVFLYLYSSSVQKPSGSILVARRQVESASDESFFKGRYIITKTKEYRNLRVAILCSKRTDSDTSSAWNRFRRSAHVEPFSSGRQSGTTLVESPDQTRRMRAVDTEEANCGRGVGGEATGVRCDIENSTSEARKLPPTTDSTRWVLRLGKKEATRFQWGYYNF